MLLALSNIKRQRKKNKGKNGMNKEQLLKDAIEKYEGEIMILQVIVMGLKTELILGNKEAKQ